MLAVAAGEASGAEKLWTEAWPSWRAAMVFVEVVAGVAVGIASSCWVTKTVTDLVTISVTVMHPVGSGPAISVAVVEVFLVAVKVLVVEIETLLAVALAVPFKAGIGAEEIASSPQTPNSDWHPLAGRQ